MIAWLGDEKLKSETVGRIRDYWKEKQEAQRVTSMVDRGQQMSCLFDHDRYSADQIEKRFGIESRITHWMARLFDRLRPGKFEDWAIDSLDAIPVGADLSKCHHRLFSWLFSEEFMPMPANKHEQHVRCAAELHAKAVDGLEPSWWVFERSAAGSMGPLTRLTAKFNRDYRISTKLAEAAICSTKTSDPKSTSRAIGLAQQATWIGEKKWADKTSASVESWSRIADKSLEIFSSAPVESVAR